MKTPTAALLLFFLLLLSGCKPWTPEQKARAGRIGNALLVNAEHALGRFALATLQNAAAHAVNGDTADFASSASVGLWAAAGDLVSTEDVVRVINASAGPAAPAILQQAGPALSSIKTPAQAQAVAVGIAAGLDSKTVALNGP